MSIEQILKALAGLIKKEADREDFLQSLKAEDGEWLEGQELASKLEAALQGKFDEIARRHYGKGQKEKAEALEKWVRDTYQVASDAQGEELIKTAVEAQVKAAKENLKPTTVEKEIELTEQTALENEVVKEIIRKRTAELEAQIEEKTTAFEDFKRQVIRNQVAEKVKTEALKVLQSANVVLGDDEETRQKRIDFFFRALDMDHFQIEADGEIVVLGENGKPLEDKHYNRVSFDQFIKSVNPYPVSKHDPDKGSPSPNSRSSSNGQQRRRPAEGAFVANSYEELMQHLRTVKDPAKRKEAIDAYQAKMQEEEDG